VLVSGYGLQLRRQGRFLFLIRDIVCANKKGYLIDVASNRKFSMDDTGLVFEFSEGIGPGKSQKSIECHCASGPLVLRSGRPGDRIKIAGGSKKVQQLFSQWQVPQPRRWQIPILEDREGIVAVLGADLGYRDRFRANRPSGRSVWLKIRHPAIGG
jgi:tRNA(Ile)-lysidine synthase